MIWRGTSQWLTVPRYLHREVAKSQVAHVIAANEAPVVLQINVRMKVNPREEITINIL